MPAWIVADDLCPPDRGRVTPLFRRPQPELLPATITLVTGVLHPLTPAPVRGIAVSRDRQ